MGQDTARQSRGWRRCLKMVLVATAVNAGLLVSDVGPAAAAATQVDAVRPAGRSFLNSDNSTLAVDAGGGTHVAVVEPSSSGGERGAYAYCSPGASCAPAQWAQVNLVPSVVGMQGPAQLELTPAGHPRILFAVDDADSLTTYRYAACDSGCTSAAGWSVLDLGSVFNVPTDVQGHSFALDPQGRPRFVYSFQDGEGIGRLYYAVCDSACTASVTNWALTTVSQGTGLAHLETIHYNSLSLDFTSAGHPRVAGFSVEFAEQGNQVAYLECDTACSAPEPVSPTRSNPNWRLTAISPDVTHALVLRLDNADRPHIMVGGSGDLYSDLRWLWCASACSTPASWSSALVGISGSDADLVFDRRNLPHVTFKGDVGGPYLGYARCRAACDTAGSPWQYQQIDDGLAFHSAFNTPEGSCAGRPPASWLVGYQSSLALDPAGNPRVSFTGYHVRTDCSGNAEANYVGVAVARFNFFPRPADFDGNAMTDRSAYRAGAWWVNGQGTQFLGLSGDIPVPADYDGSGDIERAVYRNGAWHIEGQPTAFFGLAGDIPVPGDYDGDGDADRAIFRPQVGGWFVEGRPTVFLGLSGDIPVPGDYDGNGDIERAVFRNGGWYVEGQGTVFFGVSGDIPVPGDYDGNGTIDRGVFRPSVGGWYVEGQPTAFLGLQGDVPVPADYDGDGDTERAVYRNGGWYVEGQETVFFGLGSDIPLPLPQAIYRRFF